MTFKSAIEDLSKSTLRAITGCLQRLEYLAGLRASGDYEHWGFGKVQGQFTATRALGEAHRSAVSEVLSTPSSTLLADVDHSTAAEGLNPQSYLKRLAQKETDLLPKTPAPGAARHLKSVLRALLGLERNRERNATRRAS